MQFERQNTSLSGQDRRIAVLSFYYDVFNTFLGALLGGAIFSQLGSAINKPGEGNEGLYPLLSRGIGFSRVLGLPSTSLVRETRAFWGFGFCRVRSFLGYGIS
jgi:hypothetical protein